MKKEKELRLRSHRVRLSNYNIIHICILTKEAIGYLERGIQGIDVGIEDDCFELCRRLLGIADKKYLEVSHKDIAEYFKVELGKAQKKAQKKGQVAFSKQGVTVSDTVSDTEKQGS